MCRLDMQLLDEAASSLPAIRTNKEDYGLATSVGAKAVKAKNAFVCSFSVIQWKLKFL